jgi:hypothetical protein
MKIYFFIIGIYERTTMPFEYIKDLEKKEVMEKTLHLLEKDMKDNYLDQYDSLRIIPREDFNSIYFNRLYHERLFDNDNWESDIGNFGLRDLLKMTEDPKPSIWDLYKLLNRFVWESRDKRALRDHRRIPISPMTPQLEHIADNYRADF